MIFPVRVTHGETGAVQLLIIEADCYGAAQVEALRHMFRVHGWRSSAAANEETSRQWADEQREEMSA